MLEKLKKIDVNKVIIGLLIFIILILTFGIYYTISMYKEDGYKTISSSKNVYATGKKEDTKKEIANESIVSTQEKELVFEEVIPEEVYTIEYFQEIEAEIDTYALENDTKKLSTVAKEKFVVLVDFIFYGTEINGVTFNELSQATQDKLVAIVNNIDKKIESKVPNYKEEISEDVKYSYTFLSEKLKQGITILDEKIEEEIGAEKYKEAKETTSKVVEKVKDTTSNIFNKGKDVATVTKDKIKNWYEEWRN